MDNIGSLIVPGGHRRLFAISIVARGSASSSRRRR